MKINIIFQSFEEALTFTKALKINEGTVHNIWHNNSLWTAEYESSSNINQTEDLQKKLNNKNEEIINLREQLSKLKENVNSQKYFPKNNGKPWNIEDDNILKEYLSKGLSIHQIAFELGRTMGAIKSRSEKLGISISNNILLDNSFKNSIWTEYCGIYKYADPYEFIEEIAKQNEYKDSEFCEEDNNHYYNELYDYDYQTELDDYNDELDSWSRSEEDGWYYNDESDGWY